MTGNEIDKLSWKHFGWHPNEIAIDLALMACKEERDRIVREIERSAKAVDAGVSQPDLWAMAKLVKDML